MIQKIKKASGLLASLGFHLFLFIALALWIISFQNDRVKVVTVASQFETSVDLADLSNHSLPIELETDPNETPATVDVSLKSIDATQATLAPEQSNNEKSDLENDRQTEIAPFELTESGQTRPTGGGLEGRSKSRRGAMVGSGGPSKESEQAVEDGLSWLANHQFENGGWRFDHRKSPKCDGRCRHPGSHGATTAATGLALMSYLGAGYTHQVGPYQQVVDDGLKYLVSRIRESRYGGNLSEGTMYAHAIATIALCESLAMTGDQSLRKPAKLAVEFILNAQHSAGGWRYVPNQPGDVTVTSWQIMALKSAKMAGIKVPAETWKKAEQFLDSVQDSSGYFGYENHEKTNIPCTSFGMLSRMYTGWHREHDMFAPGHSVIRKAGPSKTNMYFNYYATQVMFHYNHEKSWPEWNAVMRDFLIESQSHKGHQKGSWHFPNKYGNEGGRLFNTCMAIMTLEVYYRYMPLYDSRKFEFVE